MKKIGLLLLGLVAAATIYYITSGSEKLTIKMKEQVAAEVASLQTQGFSVESKEISEKKEHFVISFNDPKKVANFFNTQGIQVTPQDIKPLKGLKLGVDVTYLADTYSAASFDIYPIALPSMEIRDDLDEDDKKTLLDIQRMLKEKTFLVHIDMNKLGTGFKGYMKDISEAVSAKRPLILTLTGFTFTGDLKDGKLTGLKQYLKNFSIKAQDDSINIELNNLSSTYALTGASKYDYITSYETEEILVTAKNEFKLTLKHLSMDTSSKTDHNLATIAIESQIDTIHFTKDSKTSILETLAFDMKAENFDMQAIEKLETIDPNNEEELIATFQQLISKGVRFEIPNFSVKQIEVDKKKFDGFTLTSTFDVDKSLDLSLLEKNPMAAIGAIDANLELTLSSQLFGVIAQQPQAVMAMMLFAPKDVNGNKVYKVELKNGKLTVNERPVM